MVLFRGAAGEVKLKDIGKIDLSFITPLALIPITILVRPVSMSISLEFYAH